MTDSFLIQKRRRKRKSDYMRTNSEPKIALALMLLVAVIIAVLNFFNW